MSKTTRKVNVEKIMAEIRRDIARRVYNDEIVPFSTSGSGDLEENLGVLSANYAVAAMRPLKSERALGRVIVFIRSIIRKCIMFCIVPIVTDQNENNRLIKDCIKDMSNLINSQNKEIETLRNRVEELEKEKKI